MKRQSILIVVLCITVFVMFSTSACSGSQADLSPEQGAPSDGSNDSDNSDTGSSTQLPSDRRVVRNASLDLVAQDVLSAYEQLLEYIQQHGGYETQRNQRQSDQYVSIDAEIRIPPEELDAFIVYADELTEVINTLITTDDITERYYDAQTRLRSMEISLDGYYDYLEQAQSIEESLSVQSQINYLTQEIEVIKGRLMLWDSQLRESTVTIRLRQLDDPVQLRKEIDWSALSLEDMAYLMQAGIKTVLNVMVRALQWLAIILFAASPIWVIALIVIIIVRRKNKHRIAASSPAGTELPHQKSQTAEASADHDQNNSR